MENIVDFQNFELNEALSFTDKRGAKKVANAYTKLFQKFPGLGDNAMGVPVTHHMGAVKMLYRLAMEDANFGREGNATFNQIKGKLSPIEVKVPELNNTAIKVPTSKLEALIEEHANTISNAANFSGPAIVEGTALYLDSINRGKFAEDLLNAFNSSSN